MRITQDALTRFGRPFAAAVAGVAMLGAMAVAQPAHADTTVTGIEGLQEAVNQGGTVTLGNDIYGWTGWGDLQPSTLTVSEDTVINGNGKSLLGVEVVINNDATLTANNVVVDDARSSENHVNEGVAPYDVKSGTLNIEGGAAITDNGNSTVITTVHVASGATANINASPDTYHARYNSDEAYSSIYGTDYAVKGEAGSIINIKGGNIADENNDSGSDKGAVVSAGTVNFTGGRAQEVTVHQPGVLNLNGGTIDKDLQQEYDTNDKGTDAALSVDDNATVYLTKGTIKSDDKSGVSSYPLNISSAAKVYAQAAGQQDVTVDGAALYIAKANGNNDGFLTDPTVSAGYSNIPGAINNPTLYVNYGDVSTFDKLVANEASSKEALNQSVVDQTKISSGYLGYHGNLNVYGKYSLNSSTLNQGAGTVTVYSVPTVADYEWYSAFEIGQMQGQGQYPDVNRNDLSYENSTYSGRKFAGWFKSGDDWNKGANFNAFDAKDNATTIGNAVSTVSGATNQTKFGWAHFADAKNLTVGAQESADGKNIRFLSTLDSRKYQKFGFKLSITYNGQTKSAEVTTTKVYDYVTAGGQPVKPNQQLETVSWGQFLAPDKTVLADDSVNGGKSRISNGEEGYFTTTLLKNVPSGLTLGSQAITVTPYWVTLDGTTVTGENQTK